MLLEDNTPNNSFNSFELIYNVKAYNRIPVCEFKSKRTGLTVVIAEVDGPVVDGFFCLATEAFDDDGLPHTLEHLVFLGSELYPYKGILDLLANRCLASGTNAWTAIDHTCYTMETAGYEGFLSLLPIYVDHILYPILSDNAFTTEIHHITGAGKDAGVVYCEMQECENTGESRLHFTMQRKMYPGHCGYSSNTGGTMKNLRESTTNEKVRDFHKQFYRPENLKIIIAGQIKPEDVFKVLEPIENKILTKGDRGPFTKPWQNPCPPVEISQELTEKYPSDDENNGMVSVSWRGPSIVNDLYNSFGCAVLLNYLTDSSIDPLQKEFVEIEDPLASQIYYGMIDNSESCLQVCFSGVPKEKLSFVKPKLDVVLRTIVEKEDINMKRLKSLIKRSKLDALSNLESGPHSMVAYLLIGHMLYYENKDDLHQYMNPLVYYEKLDDEPKSYWVALLAKWLVDNHVVSIQGVPSIEEKQQLTTQEKARIDAQILKLTEEGLLKKDKELKDAIAFNEKPPPADVLTSVPIPGYASIIYHEITRYSTSSKSGGKIDLSNTPIYTYFDDLKSNFVYMKVMMDSSDVPIELRLYLPLLMETLLELPVERDGQLVSHKDVIAQLQDDTISVYTQIGWGGGQFSCGSYSHTTGLNLQVEPKKFQRGIVWMRELLYQIKFTSDRVKVIATKMLNDVADAKRSGCGMLDYVMRAMCYTPNSNQQITGVLKQQKFLTQLIENLNANISEEVLESLEKVRSIITEPSNICLHLAADLENLNDNPVEVIKEFLTPELNLIENQQSLKATPDWRLLLPKDEEVLSHCVVGMGSLESTEFQQFTPVSIHQFDHPDMPAVLLYAKYLTQAEGPLWKQIRGKGYAYGFGIGLTVEEAALYISFTSATDVVAAYKATYDIITNQISAKEWDKTLLESAKSSLIFEFIQGEESIGSVVWRSLRAYFRNVSYEYNRTILHLIDEVTIDDLNRIGEKYFTSLFDSQKAKTAIVCDSSKSEDIANSFKQFNIELKVYTSVEESFLNT